MLSVEALLHSWVVQEMEISQFLSLDPLWSKNLLYKLTSGCMQKIKKRLCNLQICLHLRCLDVFLCVSQDSKYKKYQERQHKRQQKTEKTYLLEIKQNLCIV